jgi:hypothetical protein
MDMTKMKTTALTILALLLAVPAVWAQGSGSGVNPPVSPEQPVWPAPSSSSPNPGWSSSTGNSADGSDAQTMTTRPVVQSLSGIELFPVQGDRAHSFLLPSFRFNLLGDSSVRNSTTGRTQFETVSLVQGRMALQRVWGRYQLNANYAGGGSLYNQSSELNSAFHELSLRQAATWRRWQILARDSFTYLPESSFGNATYGFDDGLGGGLGPDFGSMLSNLNPLFIPGQTIMTVHVPRISNTIVGEAAYAVSPRATFTVSGSYGILSFQRPTGTILNTQLLDNHTTVFRTGYNYALSPDDTVGVIYGASFQRYNNSNFGSDIHLAHLGYARRLTPRLTAQISAGPQMILHRGTGVGLNNRTDWSMYSALFYHHPILDMGANYLKGTNSGSGVLPGAQIQQVQAWMSRQFSPMWTGALSFGYARNQDLLNRSLNCGSGGCLLDNYYANVSVARRVGRHLQLTFSSGMDWQNSNVPFCTGISCGTSMTRYRFGVGVEWAPSPIEIH